MGFLVGAIFGIVWISKKRHLAREYPVTNDWDEAAGVAAADLKEDNAPLSDRIDEALHEWTRFQTDD